MEGVKTMSVAYVNYKHGSVSFDTERRTFDLAWDGLGRFVEGARITAVRVPGEKTVTSDGFDGIETEVADTGAGRTLTIKYSGGPDYLPFMRVVFRVTLDWIELAVRLRDDSEMSLEGGLPVGADPERSTFAACLDRKGGDMRVADGPGASIMDNALFDRLSDTAVEITGPSELRLSFDWDRKTYRFAANTGSRVLTRSVRFRIHRNYYETKFGVPYRPVTGETQFKTPPVGWMTWYAVKFDASEETVLENARWQAEHLKPFGADCLWVDWEWYHSRIGSVNEHPDIDTFSPDPRRYPNGLKHVSDEIRSLGLVPALWIGATNDPNRNRMLQEHPEWIMAEEAAWCGRWWIDPSHPDVVGTYIPAVFRQLLEWGYEAFKWDCIPISLQMADKYHDRFARRVKSSEQALRDVIRAAREVIGPERYLMSCSGQGFRDISLAIDTFDGGRIGGDIFGWDEYIEQAVRRVFRYLCFNNILFYADLDNVVVRGEYNTFEQARSRVSFSGLTGTPVTFGDRLPELEEERVDLLKRIIPVMDLHPMDLDAHEQSADTVVMNLLVARPFETWNVVDVFNTTDTATHVRLDLCCDLHLDTDADNGYLVYDYWDRTFLGRVTGVLDLELPPHGSRVLSFRSELERPQIVSTSRHIGQGAQDLIAVEWDEKALRLSGRSRVVQGDPYRISLHIPPEYSPAQATADVPSESADPEDRIHELTLHAADSGEYSWSMSFTRT